eukprot:TRINITY_DN2296_c0_g1_i1.p1 TRINITY_DN2296_c0_g1~~TRINITY_DN2296_c0_g1_i1.p1  ORF type:complete len:148 (-),score=8.07 TRINITY_DN2296_c0_g1_i1:88-531(-)
MLKAAGRVSVISSHMQESLPVAASGITAHPIASTDCSLSSHVLDTSLGTTAKGMPVKLEKQEKENTWTEVFAGATDADGRVIGKLFPKLSANGTYRVTFDTAAYFKALGVKKYFYPYAAVVFTVESGQHYHVPLLISPYGYSTYRGS